MAEVNEGRVPVWGRLRLGYMDGVKVEKSNASTKKRSSIQYGYRTWGIRWFLTATSGTKSIIVSAGHVYIRMHQRENRGSTIQYGYRKRGTHARVFSQTLTHGNNKNEIRQWDRRRRTEERREYRKKVQRAWIKEVPTAYHILNEIQ